MRVVCVGNERGLEGLQNRTSGNLLKTSVSTIFICYLMYYYHIFYTLIFLLSTKNYHILKTHIFPAPWEHTNRCTGIK